MTSRSTAKSKSPVVQSKSPKSPTNKPNASKEPAKSESGNIKKMLIRSAVGIAMIAVFAAVLASPHVVVILPVCCVLLQVLVYKEIIAVRYRAVKERKVTLFRTLNWGFLVIVLFYFYGMPVAGFLRKNEFITRDSYNFFRHYHLWISFCAYVFAFVGFIFSLRPGMYKYQFTQLAWTADFTTGPCTPISVWVPTEFEIPSFLQSLGLASTYTFAPIYIHAVLLAIFASLIAPFGGFFASGMKRAYNIKDFNSIFPGHGGFYDRFDCQLLMTLCTFVHFRTFVQFPVRIGVEQMLSSFGLLSQEEQLQLLEQLQSLVK